MSSTHPNMNLVATKFSCHCTLTVLLKQFASGKRIPGCVKKLLLSWVSEFPDKKFIFGCDKLLFIISEKEIALGNPARIWRSSPAYLYVKLKYRA